MSIPATSSSASGQQPDAVSGPGTPFVPLTSARPEEAPSAPTQAPTVRAGSTGTSDGRFSVLNDFRYLTDSDQRMLAAVTGEKIEPDFTDRPGPVSAFALQLALDRRTGELAPQQPLTPVYLRNAADALETTHAGRPGFTNPYSGEVMDQALAWLDAHGTHQADLRL